MRTPSRDLVVLAMGQALTSTVISLLTSVSSLSGAFLAPNPALSTVPVSATVLGVLLMIYPASSVMGRYGRRNGFLLKALVGVSGGLIAAEAMRLRSFELLVLGAFLLGVFSAFGQYYRFAAIDAARNPGERTFAVSLVTGAGVIGGVAGPFLGGRFAGSFATAPYSGAFLALSAVCVSLAASQIFLSADLGCEPPPAPSGDAPLRPSGLGAQFFKASLICAIGFAVMTLIMNAAPLAIHRAGYSIAASSRVLQTHFALMYLPSFINPFLAKRYGLRGMVRLGALMGGAACLLAVLPHQNFALYMAELGLAGVTWNFIFNGGTLLLASTYSQSQKIRAQGLNSTLVYIANLFASFTAGGLLAESGWAAVNLACIPLLAAAVWALPARAEKPVPARS